MYGRPFHELNVFPFTQIKTFLTKSFGGLYELQNVTAAIDRNIFSDSVCNSHFPINIKGDGLWSGGGGQLLFPATVSFRFRVN